MKYQLPFKQSLVFCAGIFLTACQAQSSMPNMPAVISEKPSIAEHQDQPQDPPPVVHKRDSSVPSVIRDVNMNLKNGDAVRISIKQ